MTRAILCCLLFLAGCAQHTTINYLERDISWPRPPAEPRIRLVNIISQPRDIRIEHSFFEKVINAVLGEPDEKLAFPYCVEKDSEGRVYVVDSEIKNVHIFDTGNEEYSLLVDEGSTVFETPVDVAVDNGTGTVYISDSEAARIHVFLERGEQYIGTFGENELARPTGIVYNDNTSELIVVDTLEHKLLFYDGTHRKLKREVGSRGNGSGEFNYPTHISLNNEGEILVTDSMNFRIQGFSKEGEYLFAFGSAGKTQGYISRPRGNAADSDGNIYIVDALLDAVQIFNRKGELLLLFGGTGIGIGEFWMPSGIYIDGDDRIYVADSFNKRIQVFQYIDDHTAKTPES